ncbi:LacI family transcriptional regulator [Microbacterium sp. LTA6]|uniref:LacI family DNA-binding transcriptional regulator n=1 Tax=unclassified Microbacterium TaxID=2609290 RepID=UPI0031399991
MTTIRDVARHASVAAMTVSRVLNDPESVAPDTRARVQQAIDELHYIPNRLGIGLRSRHTRVLALVVSDIRNPFAIKQILGVSTAARQHDYTVIFVHTDASPDEEMAQLRSLVERRVDGVILSPVLNTPDAVQFLLEQRIPVVVLDYPMPEVDVDTVRCDSVIAAHGLTEHLISLGHERIAMLSGSAKIVTARERAAGYASAMAAAGLGEQVLFGEYSAESGGVMAETVLRTDRQPTAFVTANNFIALGAARAAIREGLRIPEDLSIVTFDDPGEDFVLDPFFTGVVQPVKKMASIATGLLLERINGDGQAPGREILLPMAFEQRASTAPA